MTSRESRSSAANVPFRHRVLASHPDAVCFKNRHPYTGRYSVWLHGKCIGIGFSAASAWREAWVNL